MSYRLVETNDNSNYIKMVENAQPISESNFDSTIFFRKRMENSRKNEISIQLRKHASRLCDTLDYV